MQNLSYENEFDIHEMNICRRKTLTCEWFQIKTRFDAEAKANPEMVISKFSYSETTDYQG